MSSSSSHTSQSNGHQGEEHEKSQQREYYLAVKQAGDFDTDGGAPFPYFWEEEEPPRRLPVGKGGEC